MSEFLKDGDKPLQLQMTALIRMRKKPASPFIHLKITSFPCKWESIGGTMGPLCRGDDNAIFIPSCGP